MVVIPKAAAVTTPAAMIKAGMAFFKLTFFSLYSDNMISNLSWILLLILALEPCTSSMSPSLIRAEERLSVNVSSRLLMAITEKWERCPKFISKMVLPAKIEPAGTIISYTFWEISPSSLWFSFPITLYVDWFFSSASLFGLIKIRMISLLWIGSEFAKSLIQCLSLNTPNICTLYSLNSLLLSRLLPISLHSSKISTSVM